MKSVVTGGAGFIASHLAGRLIAEGHEVIVIDDLSSGKKENVPKGAKFIKKDIRRPIAQELKGVDAVFHLAADPDVRGSALAPARTFDLNVNGTFSVLESCRKADVKQVIFASTSTVYGEAETVPTPETAPCSPISNYGASKLAGESYLSAYAGSYGIRGTTLRFANIFGERSTHGVMFDFYRKLKKDPEKLEILGNGKQDKSYLHVDDCVSGVILAWKKQKAKYDVFNVGSREKVKVDQLTRQICKEMGLSPEFKYTGTERGWVGDVRLMLLDTSKLEALGWKEGVPFAEGMKRYVRWLDSDG